MPDEQTEPGKSYKWNQVDTGNPQPWQMSYASPHSFGFFGFVSKWQKPFKLHTSKMIPNHKALRFDNEAMPGVENLASISVKVCEDSFCGGVKQGFQFRKSHVIPFGKLVKR